MNKRPLPCVLAGFVLGEVWINQFHGTAAKAAFILAAIILIVMSVKRKGSFFLFVVIGLLLGGYLEGKWQFEQRKMEALLDDRNYVFEGTVEEIKELETGNTWTINNIQVDGVHYDGKILVYFGAEVKGYLGCNAILKGIISSFPTPTNPGEFDQRSYQKSKGILACMYEADLLELRYGGFLVKEGIMMLREKMATYMEQNMSKERYAIANAMILGDKSELLDRQKNLFEAGGISHILAVSGLHMTLIGAGIYKILRRIGFSYGVSVVCSFPCIFAYAVLTGMSSSCLRATVMLVIYLFAQWGGYSYDLPSSISLAGILLLIENPSRLFNSGFLLSFGAMTCVGIIWPYLAEKMEYKKSKDRIKLKLFESFLSGFTVTIFTIPISLYYFYGFSIIGLVLNLIVIPLMSVLVPLLSVGCFGWIPILPDILCKGCFGIAGLIIDFYQYLCEISEGIPFSFVRTGYRGILFVVFYYMIVIFFCIWLVKRKEDGRFVLRIGSCICILAILILFTGRNDCFLTVLDVGQGDGILYHSDTGKICMIDGGSTSKSKVGAYVIEPAFEYYGISKVDYWFLSHMDEDHISGARELFEKSFPVEYVVFPDLKVKTKEQKELESVILKNNTKILYMSLGESLEIGEESFYCLHPSDNVAGEDANQNSLVLMLTTKKQQILLTGDVELEGEEQMTEYLEEYYNNSLNFTERILKVAHHGSANGTSEAFLKVFMPGVSIVSCGKNNRYGHPASETVERVKAAGSILFNTANLGAIEIRCREKAVFHQYGQ